MSLRYLSVFSGIEAASVAWEPLGFTPVAFSEIEPFPCAVLAHHYPNIRNLGDVTKFHEWPDLEFDMLASGSPCQAFSISGLRAGLADPRGNLTLTFLGVAARYRPRWFFWENVPGVLSSVTTEHPPEMAAPNDLREGEEREYIEDYEVDSSHAISCFMGGAQELGYSCAMRCLDARHFGLAQRRKRVFVVGYLGDWRGPAEVLFDAGCLRRNPKKGREAREEITGTLSTRTSGGGGFGTDFDLAGGLQASTGGADENDARDGRLVLSHTLTANGFDASEDGSGRGTPIVAIPFDTTQITSKTNRSQPKDGDPCHPLAAFGHPPAVAFSCKDYGADAGDICPTLRSMGHSDSHPNGGGQVAIAFHPTQDPINSEEITHALSCGSANGSASVGVVDSKMAVRRLTPTECERLMGFRDGYTNIPVGKKRTPAKDGPRYKALGNSWAVPCVRWIGQRIKMVDAKLRAPMEVEF